MMFHNGGTYHFCQERHRELSASLHMDTLLQSSSCPQRARAVEHCECILASTLG